MYMPHKMPLRKMPLKMLSFKICTPNEDEVMFLLECSSNVPLLHYSQLTRNAITALFCLIPADASFSSYEDSPVHAILTPQPHAYFRLNLKSIESTAILDIYFICLIICFLSITSRFRTS